MGQRAILVVEEKCFTQADNFSGNRYIYQKPLVYCRRMTRPVSFCGLTCNILLILDAFEQLLGVVIEAHFGVFVEDALGCDASCFIIAHTNVCLRLVQFLFG